MLSAVSDWLVVLQSRPIPLRVFRKLRSFRQSWSIANFSVQTHAAMVNFLLNPIVHRLRLPQGPTVNFPGQLCFAHLYSHVL